MKMKAIGHSDISSIAPTWLDVKIEYLDEVPDALGRRRFFLNWVELSGKKRAQIFFADPKIYLRKFIE